MPGLIFKRFGYEYRSPFVCPAIQLDHLIQLVFSEALCNGHDYLTNMKHFRVDIQLYQHEWKLGKREIVWKHDARRVECFRTISSFPNFHEC